MKNKTQNFSDFSELLYDSFADIKSCPLWCNELMAEGCEPITPREFYTSIFRQYLEPKRNKDDYKKGEYGAIALELSRKGRKTARRTTITRDLTELWEIINTSDKTCFIAPFSYAGLQRTNKNARFMYAMCIEIDGIKADGGIEELFYSWNRKAEPKPQPTYIVASGSGLHLYFVFDKPVAMYPKVFEQFTKMKKDLTQRFWTPFVTTLDRQIQYESLNQAFRMPGTLTKNGARALAFRVGKGQNVTVEYMNQFVRDKTNQVNLTITNSMSREEAKKAYPEWYQRVVVSKQPRGTYSRHEGIYHNWKQKIYYQASEGHRYNCMENLCALAVQCHIPREQLVKDCEILAEKFETLTNKDNNHFTQYDIDCALKVYDHPNELAYRRKIEIIADRTGIKLLRAKRNGRTQKQHLMGARAIQKISDDFRGTNWREGNGRPSKQFIVQQWRESHPDGRKIDCERDTGLSRHTVLKWWGV